MSNKKKRIVGYLLLVFVLVGLKLFLGGPYLYNFWEELISVLLCLLIVSFILMIVPFILKLVNKKRFEYYKGKKICFFNSVILFVVFSVPNFLKILEGSTGFEMMSIDPVTFAKVLIKVYFIIAIIYYFINMCFFVENKNTKQEK